MIISLQIPDEDSDLMIALKDVLPFVARCIRAEALLSQMTRSEMLRLTSSQASLQGVQELQRAVGELLNPKREIRIDPDVL
jgi:hypothetical protein